MKDLKKFFIIIGAGVVVALVLLGLWWFFFAPKAGFGLEFEPITVEAETVRRGSIVRRITVVGTLKTDIEVMIHPEIDGKIKKINFSAGNFVKQGDPLVEIADDIYKAEVKAAERDLQFANPEYNRFKILTAKAREAPR